MDQSFLDPRSSEDGTPYGPKRYKEIVKECWYISENLHTSYADVLDMSFIERAFLIQFIRDKQEATKQAIEAARSKQQNSN